MSEWDSAKCLAPSVSAKDSSASTLFMLPQKIIEEMPRHPLLRGLFPTAQLDIFPRHQDTMWNGKRVFQRRSLIACLSGRGWVRLGQEEVQQVETDAALLIPPNMPHAYGADEERPWSIIWAHCRGDELPYFQKMPGVSEGHAALYTSPSEPSNGWNSQTFTSDWKAGILSRTCVRQQRNCGSFSRR